MLTGEAPRCAVFADGRAPHRARRGRIVAEQRAKGREHLSGRSRIDRRVAELGDQERRG